MIKALMTPVWMVPVLFLLTSQVAASTFLPYNEEKENSASIYTVHDNNFEVLHDKNITVEGRILKVGKDENYTNFGRNSIIINNYNIFNIDKHGYTNNPTRIVFPPDLSSGFDQSIGKKILIRGNVSAAGLLQENLNEENLTYIQFEYCTVWLEP